MHTQVKSKDYLPFSVFSVDSGVATKFTTADVDHDGWDGGNCAETTGGGWWFDGCYANTTNLNGLYENLKWGNKSITKVEMKLRAYESF